VNALMYHDIVAAGDEDTSGFPGRDAALYKITPEAFAAHLDAIATDLLLLPLPRIPRIPLIPPVLLLPPVLAFRPAEPPCSPSTMAGGVR
jgi:hypothetical protein